MQYKIAMTVKSPLPQFRALKFMAFIEKNFEHNSFFTTFPCMFDSLYSELSFFAAAFADAIFQPWKKLNEL